MKPLRIITNGRKFRIEFEATYVDFSKNNQYIWVPICRMNRDLHYCSNEMIKYDKYDFDDFEFDSKKEAVEWIEKQYGQLGLESLERTWNPV